MKLTFVSRGLMDGLSEQISVLVEVFSIESVCLPVPSDRFLVVNRAIGLSIPPTPSAIGERSGSACAYLKQKRLQSIFKM